MIERRTPPALNRSGAALLLLVATLVAGPARAGDPDSFELPVDLDGMGADSLVQIFRTANDGNTAWPNVACVGLINRTNRLSYVFDWPRAGPGGFAGRTLPGTAQGTGVIWRWDTIGQVCPNPCNPLDGDCLEVSNVNQLNVSSTFELPGLTTTVCEGGAAHGRACVTHASCPGGACQACGLATNVSAAALVSSMHAAFGGGGGGKKQAPAGTPALSDQTTVQLLHVDSQVLPAVGGGFLTKTRVVNLSSGVLAFEFADGRAFADLGCGTGQVNCGDVCCDGNSCDLLVCDGLQCNPPQPQDCLPPGQMCGGSCVNVSFDEQHCGACAGEGGAACASPTGCCVDGVCAPCEAEGTAVALRSGEEAEFCQTSDHPAKAVLTKLLAFCDPLDPRSCNENEPGARGMVNVLVPDLATTLPTDAPFLTLAGVGLDDGPSGDGLAQPGETVDLLVTLDNAGPVALPAGAKATLFSPSLCEGGTAHGTACVLDTECPGGACPRPIAAATATYGLGVGAGPGPSKRGPTTDCDTPVTTLPQGVNTAPFSVSIPADHAVNATRMFELSFKVCAAGPNDGEACRVDADCGTGSCRSICSDGAGSCLGDTECNPGATCIDPVVRFPLGVRCCGPAVKAAEVAGGAPSDVGCGALFQPPLFLAAKPAVMVWSPVGGAYDMVAGDLANLRDGGWVRGGGDPALDVTCLVGESSIPFTRLTRLCNAGTEVGRVCGDDGDCPGGACQCPDGNTCMSDPAVDGQGQWFLVRDPGGAGFGDPPDRDLALPDCP